MLSMPVAEIGLGRKPFIPASKQLRRESSSIWRVSATMGTVAPRRELVRRLRVAASPSMPGMDRSIRISPMSSASA